MVANLRNVDDDFARRIAEGLGLDAVPDADAAVPRADHRPAGVTCAQHRAQRPGRASPAARSACSSPTGRTGPPSRRSPNAASAEGALVELVAAGCRRDRHLEGRAGGSAPERRRWAVGPVRRRRPAAVGRGRSRARRQRRGEGLRHRCSRPLQVHRLQRGGPGPLRRHRPERADRRRLPGDRRRGRDQVRRDVSRACGSGSASHR